MATMALPIWELEQSVDRAQAETKKVATYSSSRVADLGTVLMVAGTTACLKWSLSALVRTQRHIIQSFVKSDFNGYSAKELSDLAKALTRMIEKEQKILAEANNLGTEIRVWWNASLLRLTDQIEYLESIAESLYVAADPETTGLMAMAATLITIPAEVKQELAAK